MGDIAIHYAEKYEKAKEELDRLRTKLERYEKALEKAIEQRNEHIKDKWDKTVCFDWTAEYSIFLHDKQITEILENKCFT